MARPRVFVSSTYYDLKFLRSSLEVFIESLGFEPVLFEKGDVAFSPIRALDQSCYKEAQNCDLFVLIIGGRYGSPTSSEGEVRDIKVDPYVSITKKEFETANKKGVPCFVLIEAGVYSEFQTYKKNKNKEINFAHVDSKNVYIFIDEILSLKINNPVFSFNHTQEIYDWLREQWCGIFKDLLQNSTSDSKIKDLQTEIKNLNQVTNSLKEYLEVIIGKVDSSNAKKIITEENQKISKEKMVNKLLENEYF
ncbi:MAG: DUF4062 domain-containing protein, partial [Acetobacter fabarum]|uniref:DUF4062 domain-containing protein n=1 Tax=Acetobacter fabarum TaxID=483199 RepID=UPI0039EC721A